MSAIRLLWHKHRIVFVVFLAACALTLFFLIRLAAFTIYWADPAHRNLTPEPWMTPGYIAHSWGLPPNGVALSLGLKRGERATLAEIARTRGIPVDELIDELTTILEGMPSQ